MHLFFIFRRIKWGVSKFEGGKHSFITNIWTSMTELFTKIKYAIPKSDIQRRNRQIYIVLSNNIVKSNCGILKHHYL